MVSQLTHLLNRPYKDGQQDCYGLARAYYRTEYGLVLRNYARPIAFDHAGLDLLTNNFSKEGFDKVSASGITALQKGDGLLFSILGSPSLNHVGIYIGSGYFIHHLYNQQSKCESLDQRWFNRIGLVVRHRDVTALNEARIGTVSLLDLLPPHLRGRVENVTNSL